MMLGTLILYQLVYLDQPERNRFCRMFYGWKDKSQYSKYTYHRKGFITDIPHISPSRSLIIVREEDAGKIIRFLRKHRAKSFVRNIVLKKSDMRVLGVKE